MPGPAGISKPYVRRTPALATQQLPWPGRVCTVPSMHLLLHDNNTSSSTQRSAPPTCWKAGQSSFGVARPPPACMYDCRGWVRWIWAWMVAAATLPCGRRALRSAHGVTPIRLRPPTCCCACCCRCCASPCLACRDGTAGRPDWTHGARQSTPAR